MISLLEFLNHVLPPESKGLRVSVGIRDKKAFPGFYKGNHELAENLTGTDGRGWDAYFALSAYREPGHRKQANVTSTRSFWLDIDAGTGKPYADADAAIEAVDKFASVTDLPLPTLVVSGNGVHAYWTLEEAVPPEVWLPAAKGLKDLTKKHNMQADPGITADIARILRPINTLNRKKPESPKEVYLVDDTLQPVVPNEILLKKFAGAENTSKNTPKNTPADPLSAAITGGIAEAAPQEPSFVAIAADKCGQLRNFRDTGGNVPEPVWYAALGVMAHCADGEKLAQEWSSGHPGYSEAETAKKFQQAHDRAGPTTCARFRDLNPDGCKGCPFNITSPIQLGKNPDTPVPPKIEETPQKHLWLPEGFRFGQNFQIMAMVRDPDSEPEDPKFIPVRVVDFPFQVDAIRVEETSGVAGDESVKISKRSPHSDWSSFTVHLSELSASNWQTPLGAKGVNCVPGTEKHFKRLVYEMIRMRREMTKEETCYNSFGWKGDRSGFVVGRRLYSRAGVTEVSGTEEFEKIADKLHPHPSGDFNMWRGLANKLFTPGCEAQAFALLCSFAAPLMDMLFASDEGGGIVSLVSHGSGRGKTTMLAAVESVWGKVTGLRITEAASLAAKFRTVGLYKNLPVVVDEWGTGDGEMTREFVTTFTGGLDKIRLTQQGLNTREQLQWRTIFIGSTNRPMVEQLRNENNHAQANRIFEVPLVVPEFITKTHSASLNRDFEKCFGLAGPIFISHLMKNYDLERVQQKANALLETFASNMGISNDARFKLRVVAAAAVAAQVLTTPDKNTGEPMLSFFPAGIIQWALNAVKNDAVNSESKTTYEDYVCQFIRDNNQDFVVVDRAFNPNIPLQLFNRPKGQCKGRYETQSERLYLPTDIMRKYALKIKVPYNELCEELLRSGMILQRNRNTILTAGVTEMSPTKLPCWEIDATHPSLVGLEELDVQPPK